MTIKTLLAVVGFSFSLFSAMVSSGASDFTWTDETGDHKWSTPGNWNPQSVPTPGKTVEIVKNKPEIIVDNDSVASFAAVAEITHSAQTPITYVLLDVTTNVTLKCRLTGYASFRLKNDVTVSVDNNAEQNFLGFQILECGTFVMPKVAHASGRGYQYGRFSVSNEATLVVAEKSTCYFYDLKCYGTLKNATSTKRSVSPTLSSATNPSIIAGTVEGPISVDGNKVVWVTGDAKPDLAFSMYCSGSEAICGMSSFAVIGGTTSFEPEYDGFHFLYLGTTGETTTKDFLYTGRNTHGSAGYWKYPMVMDAGEFGGVTFTGAIRPYYTDNSARYSNRLVFQGSNTNAPCVLRGSFPVGDIAYSYTYFTNLTQYVTKRGTGIWRFAEPNGLDYKLVRRQLMGTFAVQEGTLQFDSIFEKGVSSAIGFSRTTQSEYKGPFDPTKDVDYAYLLGTVKTNENGEVVSATAGKMEFTGTNACTATTRPFRLLGNGAIGNAGTSRIALGDFMSITNGEKTLTLDGETNDFGDAIKDVRDGTGTVSVVKAGAGTWKLTGELSFSGDLKVKGGTLVVANPTNRQAYKWFRFTKKQGYGTTAWFPLGKLAFYDANGKRQGMGLKHKCPATGYQIPYCDYQNAAENTVMLGRWGYLYYIKSAGTWLEQLCSDNASAAAFVTCVFLDSGQKRTTRLDDPDSWIPVVARLPDTTPEIVSYDLVSPKSRTDTYCGKDGWPAYWSLEGSPDGVFWDRLDEKANVCPENDNSWYSDGQLFVAGETRKYDAGDATPKGFPIASARAPRTDTALANVRSVSVAAGATLVGEGRVRTLDALEVSASGMGTIEGFALAEAGSIDFTGVDETAKEIVIPADFSKLPDWMNLAGWSFTVNGEENAKFAMSVGPDGFRLCKKGLMLILR